MKIVELVFLLCGVCVNTLYLIGNELFMPGYILLAVVLWLSASALHLAIHEIGHLVGGLISGYNLVFFSIGSVKLSYSQKKKFTVSIGKSHGGQCIMEPRNTEICHYLCYNLGGVFANLLLALAAGGLLLFDLHCANLLFINIVCVGTQKIFMNSIPSNKNGAPNDAFVVKLLSHNEHTQRDYCMYLKLYASYYREDSIDCKNYEYYRPLDVAENELLYYHEIQSILTELNQVVVD